MALPQESTATLQNPPIVSFRVFSIHEMGFQPRFHLEPIPAWLPSLQNDASIGAQERMSRQQLQQMQEKEQEVRKWTRTAHAMVEPFYLEL